MDLNAILKKTKKRSEQIKIVRKPVSIATEDRPYTKDASLELAFQSNNKTTACDSDKAGKSIKNWQQTGNENGNKLATNRHQTSNKLVTNWQQISSQRALYKNNWQQTDNKTGNENGNKLATNRHQTSNKSITRIPFSALVGLQRNIIIFIYQECKTARAKITEALTLEHIASYCGASSGTVKTTLQRLETKGCIVRCAFKNGRGGWSKYELPEEIFHELLQNENANKLATNR